MNFNLDSFKPVDNNIIVIPGKVKKVKTLQMSPVEGTTKKDIDKVKALKKEYVSLPTNMRIGVVVAIAEDAKVGYSVGDTVVYNANRAYQQKLDLLAKKSDDDTCPIIMRAFEILATVKIEDNE